MATRGESKVDEVANVSMANTKNEMLAAYNELKARFEAESRELFDVRKQKEKLEREQTVAAADKVAEADVLVSVGNLKTAVARELEELAARIEAERGRYSQLKAAIEIKQDELNRIYEVETAASDLVALIEAQKQRRHDFEEEMTARKTTLETEIAATRAEWEREATEHARAVNESREREHKQREQEREDFEYGVAREQERRRNALADEMAALEREIAGKREEFERQQAEKMAALQAREEAVARREERMTELEAQVAGFPAELQQKIDDATASTRDRLTADFEKGEMLLRKEYEGEKNVLTSRLEAMEKVAAAQERQIQELMKQQEKAYEKVQDIASKAVAGAKTQIYRVADDRRNDKDNG